MDKDDKRILGILKENSRSSVREIAARLHMRPSTVHVRMTKLYKKGIIQQYTIRTNDKAVDEGFIVFMMIKESISLEKALLQQTCVKEVFHITGEYTLLIKLKLCDVEAFNSFMQDFRKAYPNVQTTHTMVATAKLKEDI